MAEVFRYTIGFDDVDATQLSADARTPGSEKFRSAVTKLLEGQYRQFGGRVQIKVDDAKKTIDVEWSASPSGPDPSDVVLEKLKRGDYQTAIPLLRILRHHEPSNFQHAYNLGMALSDMGVLEKAEQELREALRLDPRSVNALVALGVVHARKGDNAKAVEVLREAVNAAPDNPWARRNLGGCLLRSGQAEEAVEHLRRSAELMPQDQQALFGLGQALEAVDETEEADELYKKVISLGASTPVGEAAKDARRGLAQKSFRETGRGVERMDAVMYCLGALEKFDKMKLEQVQNIAFEIALLGMKGLDTNDPTQKYALKSLPGQFSGLHLVCLMYVGFKLVAPQHDVGFDLSREYAAALALQKK